MGKDNIGTLNPHRHHQFLSAVTKSATVRGAKGEEGGGTHGEAVGRFSVGDRAPEGQRQRWDRWERGRSLSPFRLVGAAGSSRPRGVRSETAISIDRSFDRSIAEAFLLTLNASLGFQDDLVGPILGPSTYFGCS